MSNTGFALSIGFNKSNQRFLGSLGSLLIFSTVGWAQVHSTSQQPQQPQQPQSTRGTTQPQPCAGNPFPTGIGGGDNCSGGAPQRTIFLSGKVTLVDGSPPPDRVKIERFCGVSSHLETYSDRKGHFSFELGRSTEIQDASNSDIGTPGSRNAASSGLGGSSMGRPYMGCELRANLPGYRADAVSLSNVEYLGDPNVGTIILHPLSKTDGFTISATSDLAPKDARKAYEKAQDAEVKNKFEDARAHLERAVMAYPRYAAAWFEMGKIDEQLKRRDDARHDYEQSLVADSKYIPPYPRLALMALADKNWQSVQDLTTKLISLDPIGYPDAFYWNGIANLQLQHVDAAEKTLREAIRLDPASKNMRARYALGVALAQKQDFAASAELLRAYLSAPSDTSDVEMIRQQLAKVEEAAKVVQAGKPETSQH